MKLLIPTAKEMNTSLEPMAPQALSSQTIRLVKELANQSVEDLAHLYKIKLDHAREEKERLQDLARAQASHYPALQLFDGLMYRQMEREHLSEKERAYIEQHLLITSSLYGILRPFQAIAPHRLDFLVPIKPDGQSLKSYWREHYDHALQGDEEILSLLSSEFEQVFSTSIREKMIKIVFKEEKNGSLKVHSTISKKGRGYLVQYMVKHHIEELSDLKHAHFEGYSYQPDLSSDKEWVFVRVVKG